MLAPPQTRKGNPLRRMMQRSNYAYANARVRVRKSKLLPHDTFAKLLKMDVPEITRFIESSEYGREIHELAIKFNGIDLLENALNVNEERNYAEVRNWAKGDVGALVGRYLARFEIWNLKTILRGRFWGATAQDMERELLIENREEYDFYRGLIEADGTGVAPIIEALGATLRGSAWAKILNEVMQKHADDPQLMQHLEDALDRSYYENLLATIPRGNPDDELFLEFIRREIDVINLSVVLRFEWRNDPSTKVLEFTIPGGKEFGPEDLRRLAEANTAQELVDRLKEFKIYDTIKDALATAQETKTLTPVLLALKRHLADFAQTFTYRNPLSVLPLVNYLLRKHYEVRNLRCVARGKAAGLSEERIQQLLVLL